MRRATAAFLVMVLFAASAPALFPLEVGEKAPPFVNLNLQHQRVWSRDHLGQRWVILDFFATDCEGCKKELPILERLQADYGSLGLEVIVFATDPQGEELVLPYFRQTPTSLTVLLDNYQTAVKRYGVKEIPSVFLVDPQGIIVLAEAGFREDLYERVSALLAAARP